MTNEEAKDLLDNLIGMVEDNQNNDYDEALKLGIKALEKQIPKEHHHTRIDRIVYDVRMSICPSCLAVIPSHRTEYPNYCIRCGQKIDWGNEE